ncbi:FAD-dependent oxidoreductase [Actinotalea sp. K2]|uniref:FAD-dependent oxidoreductase n=1 Tax=Actinotalea sp. K2 TaxID=2939438 RepID=UPI002016F877|nr:FAD-dependent oxidoreductase [Actinotalea sp. K2]MCL3862896.1 FAD-dependent oxidoreductase [Actinotalea sp. K2]
MQQRVVVVGGGFAGSSVARALDEVADVVLVEPKDAFVYAAATLRAVVDESWQKQVFYPYDHLLTRGRVVHDQARLVSPNLVRVSAHDALPADYLVLATGTSYPFPARFLENRAADAVAHLSRMREALARCERVLLVGAGPVGLELAGELTSAFPGLAVTVVEQEPDILTTGDYLPELRHSVRHQLEKRGVTFVVGAPLGHLPPVDVGTYGQFTVETTTGARVEAQMWFRCFGTRARTEYLDDELSVGLRHDGTIPVTQHLNVHGQRTVFAIGDTADIGENKRISAARDHATVVAQNITDLIEGREPSATYTPAPERIVLALGPDAGAAQITRDDGSRMVLGPRATSEIKGKDLSTYAMSRLFAGPQGIDVR